MEKTTIRLGGVPEHFNLPIHLAKEKGKFDEIGVDLQWTTFDGGTGQMTKALRGDEVDACVLLTEGIIKDVIKGNPAKIVSVYVNTPLTWGIHTGSANALSHHKDIYDKRYAISRFGSGSHLMSIVDAQSNEKTIDESQFHIIKNLDGALASLSAEETDVFYWEKFTTKPFVDNGTLKRVGEYVTPWPCFVIAATDKILEQHHTAIIRMLRVIHEECDLFMMNEEESIAMVSDRYNLELKDAARWYHSTEWAIHGWVSAKMIKSVLFNLKSAGIIEQSIPLSDLVYMRE